jgi:iron complex transport system ATP-binding protein
LDETEPLVRLSQIGLKIGGKRILSSVNFKLHKGERWAIIGPNGSGKTTLLRIISGYLRPSSGLASFHGQNSVNDLESVRKTTGFVSSFLDNLVGNEDSVLDIVVSGRFGATKLWGIPDFEIVDRARKLMVQLGCEKFEDRRLSELSQGERQKILIARAMMPEPVLLTFDEPCASLDLATRETFLRGLETIARRHRSLSMIYVTHRIDEIPSVFDRTLLLKNGKVVASGKSKNVLNEKNLSACLGVKVAIKKWRNRFYPVVCS